MSQEHNRYPLNKLSAYTMLSKFMPEKKQPSNTNRDRDRSRSTTVINVFFYQRREPVEGPPILGTNGAMKNMVDCWNCGRKGHIYPFSKSYRRPRCAVRVLP